MTRSNAKRVSFTVDCLESLGGLPGKVVTRFHRMVLRYRKDPSAKGLNLETVKGAGDKAIKSIRVDQGYRAIAVEEGREIMFVHVDEHDKAYRWARGRRVKLDPNTNRIRVIDTTLEIIPKTSESSLLAGVSDQRLVSLGVTEEELPYVRSLSSVEELEEAEGKLDPLSFQVIYGLAIGYGDEEVRALTGVPEAETPVSEAGITFDRLIETDESRQTIFIPESEAELRRVFEGDLRGWKVFLHPDQRGIAYRDYNGPAMARGGAGTGKTVVAMHRAKHIADGIAKGPSQPGQRVLFTTFTANLARDIETNLRSLCPEHLDADPPRIEVVNLDRWVFQFLRRENFERRVAYSAEDRRRLDEIWSEVFENHNLPGGLSEAFVKSEWERVVQAKGLIDQQAYLKVSRAGRGTALDRRKRAALWEVFADYRARVLAEGLAEPDDAYREAIRILSAGTSDLPYTAAIVDEAQDMGEQALRLVRAIVPEKADGDRNSIFVVGDAHQRIYARKASLSACGIDVRGRSKRLRLNYRTTRQIRTWAVSILEGVSVDDLDEGVDTLRGYVSLLNGPTPELIGCDSEAGEIEGLVRWIRTLSADHGLKGIGVLCGRNKDVEHVRAELESAGIDAVVLKPSRPDDPSVEGVRIATMHRAKGLEFLAVAIPFLSEGTFPPAGALRRAVDAADRADMILLYRSLLHVAATRAKKNLRISWAGRPSGILPVSDME